MEALFLTHQAYCIQFTDANQPSGSCTERAQPADVVHCKQLQRERLGGAGGVRWAGLPAW